ncbi:Rotatin [Acropora cervicornis]|uniref:Rotatin n=1 Tax=Acropora cervicornis TaxID=6130 RepID=A0AAD9Q5K4_ACRCE|nr:Rotatin [Acropora cervicornis]
MDDGINANGKRGKILSPAANCSFAVQPFIKKLGHEVEEIRVRALKNILFKLDHKLVCAVDLVHEKQLLINLLKWFNFSNPPLKSEVLRLLQILSKVGSFI